LLWTLVSKCLFVVELLGSVEEVYAQQHPQSDIGFEADQHARWKMPSKFASCMSFLYNVQIKELKFDGRELASLLMYS